ncbi:MAG: nuclear transport factor 2 family protein [Actinobacteria bacterium]|nr:nuclear transport factor 2 family protein [Actinomycetota bacterium]
MRPSDVARRWIEAINKHDLDEVATCFAPGYEDEAPARTGEFVRGRDHVRRNFERFFTSMSDIHAELRSAVDQEDTVWMEWSMEGTRLDGTHMKFVGVNVFEVRDGAFVKGRIYTELVREAGGVEAQVRRMAGEKSSS